VDFSGYAFGVRTEETTQRFPLGTFKDYPDGRRFRYCYVGTGGLQAEFGCCFPYKTIAYAVAAVQASGAGTAGSYKVSVTIGASEEPQSGVFSINDPFLVGGYIVVGNGGNQHPQNRMIVGNTAVTTAGGVCTLTLDEPLESVCTAASTGLEIMFNRYAYVTSMNVTNSGYVTPIGMPAVTCDAGAFAWVQTRGPCWITSDSNTCNSDGDRRIYFANNGSCVSGNDITGDVGVQVFAGNAIDASSDGASNAPFVYLQLE
jgi:hypothetical protein